MLVTNVKVSSNTRLQKKKFPDKRGGGGWGPLGPPQNLPSVFM